MKCAKCFDSGMVVGEYVNGAYQTLDCTACDAMARKTTIRKLQDELLSIAYRRGLSGADIAWSSPRITVKDLETCIYPELEHEFRRVVNTYR